MKKIKSYVFFIISILLFSSFILFIRMTKPVVFKRVMSVIRPVEYNYQTTISIADSRNEIKLVTAKQYIDFINVMDGRDGNFIQISTYEVIAGIDFSEGENAKVKILSEENTKIGSDITIRNFELLDDANTDYTKPLEAVYRRKALEYACQNKILEKAKKQAEEASRR